MTMTHEIINTTLHLKKSEFTYRDPSFPGKTLWTCEKISVLLSSHVTFVPALPYFVNRRKSAEIKTPVLQYFCKSLLAPTVNKIERTNPAER